jgi:hypothetical protein
MPADGTVTRIAYRHGKFLSANLDKSSDENERNALAIRLDDGREIAVVQIAGLIARRILCDVKEGDHVLAGSRFGIIRFGSRTDLYLPEGVLPLVTEGQTMIGGETVIADITVDMTAEIDPLTAEVEVETAAEITAIDPLDDILADMTTPDGGEPDARESGVREPGAGPIEPGKL